jgi:hypothetical protein
LAVACATSVRVLVVCATDLPLAAESPMTGSSVSAAVPVPAAGLAAGVVWLTTGCGIENSKAVGIWPAPLSICVPVCESLPGLVAVEESVGAAVLDEAWSVAVVVEVDESAVEVLAVPSGGEESVAAELLAAGVCAAACAPVVLALPLAGLLFDDWPAEGAGLGLLAPLFDGSARCKWPPKESSGFEGALAGEGTAGPTELAEISALTCTTA